MLPTSTAHRKRRRFHWADEQEIDANRQTRLVPDQPLEQSNATTLTGARPATNQNRSDISAVTRNIKRMAAEMLDGEADETTRSATKLKLVAEAMCEELMEGEGVDEAPTDRERVSRRRRDNHRFNEERLEDERLAAHLRKGRTTRETRISSIRKQREDSPQQYFTCVDGHRTAGHRATQARVGHLPWGWKEILAKHKKAQIHGWLCRKCEDNEDHWEALRRQEEANKKELEEEMARE